MSDLALYRQYSLALNAINDQMVKMNNELAAIIIKDHENNRVIIEDQRARDLLNAVMLLRPTFEYFNQQKMRYYNKLNKKE